MFAAGAAAERGLPPIEFRFDVPPGLAVNQLPPAPPDASGIAMVLSGEELDSSGRRIGWIEIGLFSASLIIDRAGALHEVAAVAAAAVLARPGRGRLLGQDEIELGGGAAGFRVDAVLQLDQEGRFRPDCPYASWLALAGDDAVVRAGLFAHLRSARPDWRAGGELLNSLTIGGGAARPAGGARLDLPLVRRR